MTNYRAQDASPFLYAGNVVGEIKSWALDGVAVESIETTNLGALVKTNRSGLVDPGTLTLGLAIDPSDGAQAQFYGFLTGSGEGVDTNEAWSAPLSGSAVKSIRGSGSIASVAIDNPAGSGLVTATVVIQNSGPVVIES